MKRFLVLLSLAALPAFAAQVDGYTRRDGTYVAPHQRTNPDSSRLNNYSTEGNVNPYTGQAGTESRYPAYNPPPAYTPPAPSYTPPPSRQSGYR